MCNWGGLSINMSNVTVVRIKTMLHIRYSILCIMRWANIDPFNVFLVKSDIVNPVWNHQWPITQKPISNINIVYPLYSITGPVLKCLLGRRWSVLRGVRGEGRMGRGRWWEVTTVERRRRRRVRRDESQRNWGCLAVNTSTSHVLSFLPPDSTNTHIRKGLRTQAAPRHGSKNKAHNNKAIPAYGTLPKSGPNNGKISLLYYFFFIYYWDPWMWVEGKKTK